MFCNPMIEPVCAVLGHLVVQSAASAAGGGIFSAIALAVTAGVRWIVVNTATWWIQIPSPNLAAEPAVTRIQQWLLPVTAAVAVAGVIAAGARMAIARRGNPLLDVTGGLLTLAAATTLGTVIPALLLRAGDAWSTWILQASTGGHFTQRLTDALNLGGNAAPAVVLIFGTIAIVLSIVQAVLMLFRQAALVILAGVLPLAAAGSVAPMTRPWLRKITAWMLALIFYKPAAAAAYAAAFTMIGSGGSIRTVLMGFVMLVLSVVALPALMKFFTWTTGTIAGQGGGGQLLGAAAVGAVAVGSMRSSGGGGAQDQAAFMTSRLGAPPGGGGGASGGSGGGSPGGSPAAGGSPGGSWPGEPAAPQAGPPGGTAPASAGSSGAPSGAASSGTASAMPAGASGGTAAGAAGAGSAEAAGGPVGAAAAAAVAAAAQTASAGAHLAAGAMEPEDQA
jgi:hypothetical protein